MVSIPCKIPKKRNRFEDHYLLCVCCVFATFPSFWRPFGAIFCLTVDATSVKVKPVRDKTSLRPKQNIAPNGVQQFGKAVKTQQTHKDKVSQTLF